MKMIYHVFQNYEAATRSIDGLMHPFNEEREEHEYSCFPSTLAHRMQAADVSMSSRPADGKRGVLVTLISILPQEDMIAALEHVLVQQNQDINGLCLVAQRVA